VRKEIFNVVFVGHVDHGKSTVIGRTLFETESLPKGKLDQIRETCRRNSKPFEYAFLLDALKDEQRQGITIDSARCFFKTEKRNYIIIDAPGHIEFLKNMVTGASRADAAFLVIDANEGVMENSRRHGYMLSMLGIKQVSVLVNKMDLVNYNEGKYNDIAHEYNEFLHKINIKPVNFIPVSGKCGDNIMNNGDKMEWYRGKTVLQTLDTFEAYEDMEEKPFRMPVQDVYKFTSDGDSRRIVAGSVSAGILNENDEVVFYPSGKKSTVLSFESFGKYNSEMYPGKAIGFTLKDQIFVKRGEVATVNGQKKPVISKKLLVNLFWLGKQPMVFKKNYSFKLGTEKVNVKLEKINLVLDASTLENIDKKRIDRHDVAECVLKLEREIAFDTADICLGTNRFVIVDDYEISGGGIIRKSLDEEYDWVRNSVRIRNQKWMHSEIDRKTRWERYNQKPVVIMITGNENLIRKEIAKELEKQLFIKGKFVYFLSINNLLYGVDADIKLGKENNREEHFRRLAEIANIMIDAGMILVMTARKISRADLDLLSIGINVENIELVWVGEQIDTDMEIDTHISENYGVENAVGKIINSLNQKGFIFNPW